MCTGRCERHIVQHLERSSVQTIRYRRKGGCASAHVDSFITLSDNWVNMVVQGAVRSGSGDRETSSATPETLVICRF